MSICEKEYDKISSIFLLKKKWCFLGIDTMIWQVEKYIQWWPNDDNNNKALWSNNNNSDSGWLTNWRYLIMIIIRSPCT